MLTPKTPEYETMLHTIGISLETLREGILDEDEEWIDSETCSLVMSLLEELYAVAFEAGEQQGRKDAVGKVSDPYLDLKRLLYLH